jgi:hypothetical protein
MKILDGPENQIIFGVGRNLVLLVCERLRVRVYKYKDAYCQNGKEICYFYCQNGKDLLRYLRGRPIFLTAKMVRFIGILMFNLRLLLWE